MPLSGRVVALLLLPVVAAAPQTAWPTSDASACSYEACALSIAPRWNGLAIVRGRSETQVANLGFLLPRDISAVFHADGGETAAVDEARRAVRIRRTAALLTDGGAVLLAVGVVRGLRMRRVDDAGAFVLGTGAAAFVVSVPLQFAADGALSRAVWLHNLRFAR